MRRDTDTQVTARKKLEVGTHQLLNIDTENGFTSSRLQSTCPSMIEMIRLAIGAATHTGRSFFGNDPIAVYADIAIDNMLLGIFIRPQMRDLGAY